jgi:hypothetical protein
VGRSEAVFEISVTVHITYSNSVLSSTDNNHGSRERQVFSRKEREYATYSTKRATEQLKLTEHRAPRIRAELAQPSYLV